MGVPGKVARASAKAEESQIIHELGALRGSFAAIRNQLGRIPGLDPRSPTEIERDELAAALQTIAKLERYDRRLRGRMNVLQLRIWSYP